MEKSANEKASNIILALDLPPEESERMYLRAKDILKNVHSQICAVKFNRHLILPMSLFGEVQKLIAQAHDYGLPAIMDCKINDIGNTNRIIAENYFNAGFDAVTANPFIGWEEGLQPVFDAAKRKNRGVILLIYMSHKGTREGYGQKVLLEESGEATFQYRVFAQKALQWNADGAVVGATYPKRIKEVYSILGEKVPIYSPGIGVQGGKIESAVTSGARYLIIGRTIMLAEKPKQIAEELKLAAQQSLRKKT